MEKVNILLSTAYFAPIQYYCKLVQFANIKIEQFENYSKQSYRNRCNIFGANGMLSLVVPIEKISCKKTLIKDVCIAYGTDWQKLHWKSIESAYKSSPYYEYYIDDFARFFNKKWNFLLDMNNEIQQEVCNALEFKPSVLLTDSFTDILSNNKYDFRYNIHPKKSKIIDDPFFQTEKYTQVFSYRHGFLPNLSILDVIFNLGPDSMTYLKSCIIKKQT